MMPICTIAVNHRLCESEEPMGVDHHEYLVKDELVNWQCSDI